MVGAKNALWAVMALLVGVLLGVGVFTFGYANGFAYFGSDPATCAQCHAMADHYEAWTKSSHQSVATCNGFWHAVKFTTGDYPDNIQIREHNLEITEHACLYCHGNMTDMLHAAVPADQTVSCTRCHSTVGHME